MVLYLNSVNYIVLKFTLKLCKPDFKVLSIVFSKVPCTHFQFEFPIKFCVLYLLLNNFSVLVQHFLVPTTYTTWVMSSFSSYETTPGSETFEPTATSV
jgi:hypothetical protein